MDFKRSKRLLAVLATCYWVLVIGVYLAAGQQFRYSVVTSDALSATSAVGELIDGMAVTQRISAPAETIISFDLMAGTYGRPIQAHSTLSLQTFRTEWSPPEM